MRRNAKYHRSGMLQWAAIGLLFGGCVVAERGGDSGAGNGIEGARQWQCDEEDTRVVCHGVLTADADEPDAYACEPGDGRVVCPPDTALADLQAALAAMDVVDELAAMPWACLRTGANGRHCMKDLPIVATDGDDPPDDTPSPDSDPPPSDEPPATGVDVPSDCEPSSWEPYFCALATSKYNANGVDITFPCDIFDALAPFGSTLDDIPTGSADADLPSCHDGEWDMRNQAWVDAVTQGCMDLDDPILVMCQQAANYAPNSGACSPTGTW